MSFDMLFRHIVITCLMCLFPAPAHATDYSFLLEGASTTEWRTTPNGVWQRKYVTEKGTTLITARIANGNVFFRAWTLCANPAEVDLVTWMYGDDVGERNDCKRNSSVTSDPQFWEDQLGDLPDSVYQLIRMNKTTRNRTIWRL